MGFPACPRGPGGEPADRGEGGAEILRAVSERVQAYARGDAPSVGVAGRFRMLERNGPLAVISEHGSFARLGPRAAGIEGYVSERAEGARRIVTVGLTGAFVPLDLVAVYNDLNAMEPTLDGDCWGGSTHVGGSPFRGTEIETSKIMAVMHRHYGRQNAVPASTSPSACRPPVVSGPGTA